MRNVKFVRGVEKVLGMLDVDVDDDGTDFGLGLCSSLSLSSSPLAC